MMLVLAFVVFLVLFAVFMAGFTLYRRKKRSFMLSVDIKYGDIVSIVIVFLYQLLRNYM